jgi:hypothetical protein
MRDKSVLQKVQLWADTLKYKMMAMIGQEYVIGNV